MGRKGGRDIDRLRTERIARVRTAYSLQLFIPLDVLLFVIKCI